MFFNIFTGNGTIFWFSQHLFTEPPGYMEKKIRSAYIQGIFFNTNFISRHYKAAG